MIDKDAKAITILDRDGKPLSKILPKGANYQLDEPVDLAFDRLGLSLRARSRQGVGVRVRSEEPPDHDVHDRRESARRLHARPRAGTRRRRPALHLRRASQAHPGLPMRIRAHPWLRIAACADSAAAGARPILRRAISSRTSRGWSIRRARRSISSTTRTPSRRSIRRSARSKRGRRRKRGGCCRRRTRCGRARCSASARSPRRAADFVSLLKVEPGYTLSGQVSPRIVAMFDEVVKANVTELRLVVVPRRRGGAARRRPGAGDRDHADRRRRSHAQRRRASATSRCRSRSPRSRARPPWSIRWRSSASRRCSGS